LDSVQMAIVLMTYHNFAQIPDNKAGYVF
jgi:hypothetical protein